MVVAAAKSGYFQWELEGLLPRVQKIPFDSDRKRLRTSTGMKALQLRLPLSDSYPPLIACMPPDEHAEAIYKAALR